MQSVDRDSWAGLNPHGSGLSAEPDGFRSSKKSWPNPINTLHGAWSLGHGVRKDRVQISIFSIGKFLGEKYGQLGD